MLKKTVNGILAGICISLGGSVFLACDNKYVGAVLFSVALLCICIKGYSLYTGKICYIPEKHGKEEISVLLFGLLGNFIASLLFGLLIRYSQLSIAEKAETVCASKLTQSPITTLIRGLFCGILIYLAVVIFRDHKKIVGILFCIPVFILAGFEHSIADMFYFSVAASFDLKSLLFILLVVIGNSVGGMLLPVLEMIVKREKKND